jgi:hypothetical protein
MRVVQDIVAVLKLRMVQLLALTALMAGVAAECFITKYSVLDPDIWWHLKVGDWIIQHRTVPHTGILSRTAANRPWMAYSWGYEVMLSRAYAWLGLLGISLFGVALTMAVAITLFWMLRRLSGDFWMASILSIAAYCAFLFGIMPRPVFFSMLLFAVTLTIILEAQRTSRARLLYWLPLVFLLWANLHIQFIYGLMVVGLFTGINLLQALMRLLDLEVGFLLPPSLPLTKLLAVLASCALAACLGPYSFHLYHVAFEYSQSKIIYYMIDEMLAPSFYGWNHFLELILAACAFFAVGWHKKVDAFKVALLIMASIFAFHKVRDAWFLCIAAVAFIASLFWPKKVTEKSFTAPEVTGVGVALVLLVLLIGRNTDFNPRGLNRAINGEFPVDAVNFLRRNPLPGPLYNSFDWGGFLTFYMPQYPVAIDGRTDLYGDDLLSQFYATESANPSYVRDPYLNEAGVVILRTGVPLAKLLPTDRRFRVIYRDEVAVVLAHN